MNTSDLVRQYASHVTVSAAQRRGDKTLSINAGTVHQELGLNRVSRNHRVPLACSALGSKKFLSGNNLRQIGKTGPRSGQSTTVTYTYEILDRGGVRA